MWPTGWKGAVCGCVGPLPEKEKKSHNKLIGHSLIVRFSPPPPLSFNRSTHRGRPLFSSFWRRGSCWWGRGWRETVLHIRSLQVHVAFPFLVGTDLRIKPKVHIFLPTCRDIYPSDCFGVREVRLPLDTQRRCLSPGILTRLLWDNPKTLSRAV